MFHRWISTSPRSIASFEEALREVALEQIGKQGEDVEAHDSYHRLGLGTALAANGRR